MEREGSESCRMLLAECAPGTVIGIGIGAVGMGDWVSVLRVHHAN